MIPDWSRVEESLAERLAQEDPNALWAKVSLCWMDTLKESLGDGFRTSSSDNFHLQTTGSVTVLKVKSRHGFFEVEGFARLDNPVYKVGEFAHHGTDHRFGR